MFEYKNIQWERHDRTLYTYNALTRVSAAYHQLQYIGRDTKGNIYRKEQIGSKEED
jgi:hypothetical protein